jgi:hypothetical protein
MEAVSGHGRIHIFRNGAKVLPDNLCAVAVGFQAQDGIQLFDGVAHIDPIAGLQPFGNPEEPVKRHHMVNAEEASVLELITEISNVIAIPLLPDRLRMQGWKPPILTSSEDSVWWCASRGVQDKCAALAPDVVAVWMDAEGKIEVS